MGFHEPALDVSLLDQTASLRHFHESAGLESKKIVALVQVYSSVSNQEGIADLCLSLIREAGVRLIAAEGGEGSIPSDPRFADLPTAMGTSEVSVGVLSAAARSEHTVEVVGVDDMEIVRRSRACWAHAERGAAARDRIFGHIRKLLVECQNRFYPPQLRKLRRRGLGMYVQGEFNLIESVKLLHELAGRREKFLVDFPRARRFHRILLGERERIDRAVLQEREEFVKRINEAALGWFKYTSEREVQVDWDKAAAAIEFWAMNMEYTQQDLERIVNAAGPASLVDNCIQWYRWWMLERAAELEPRQQYKLFEDLMRFALYAGIPFYDLRALRKYMAYLRDADGLAHMGLLEEITEATRMLADGLGAEASALFRTEEVFEELYAGLRLTLLPHHADPDGLSVEVMEDALAGFARMVDLPRFMTEPSYLADLKDPLTGASGYVRHSAERSRLMAERTIEALGRRRQQRAILVTGGFHEPGIRWALEEVEDLTWSVVSPNIDFDRDGIAGRQFII
jgi:hypothetical protein